MLRIAFSLDLRKAMTNAGKNAGLLYYGLWLGPRGKGRVSSVETTDRQYRDGYWENFETPQELPRYAVIASLIRALRPDADVLDVGCGYGTLAADLAPYGSGSYAGFDQSQEAIARAQAQGYPRSRFEVGDFNAWQAKETYDVIVFNDTLYYALEPVALIRRYVGALRENGVMLVAMFRHRNTMIIWKNLAEHFATLEEFELKNTKGEVTDIRVLVPR